MVLLLLPFFKPVELETKVDWGGKLSTRIEPEITPLRVVLALI